MLKINRAFQLTEDQEFLRGQEMPADVWQGLRPRLQTALKNGRYVLQTEDTPTSPLRPSKRGK